MNSGLKASNCDPWLLAAGCWEKKGETNKKVCDKSGFRQDAVQRLCDTQQQRLPRGNYGISIRIIASYFNHKHVL